MKLKQVIGSLTAAATIIATTAFPQMPVYAATDFATAQDFLTDVINNSLAEIESSGKAAAVNTTAGKITTSGNEVLFDSTHLGYWTSSTSSTLYADEACTVPLIEEVAEGYDCDPTVLKTLLADTNSNIVENYTPTTDDWSKIVGRYDITLGDITIPAEQWIPMEISAVADPITNNDVVDITTISGIHHSDLYYKGYDENVYVLFYVIDNTGSIYLQNNIVCIYDNASRQYELDSLSLESTEMVSCKPYVPDGSTWNSIRHEQYPYIKTGISVKEGKLYSKIYLTTATNSSWFYVDYNTAESTRVLARDFHDLSSVGSKYTYDAGTIKSVGCAYFTPSQISDVSTLSHTMHLKMFESYSTSRLVRGSTKLTKRVNALSRLTPSDVITVKADGWYMVDGSNIDTHITTQNIQSAGDTADISAVADVEPLNFNVIVPSALPIYVDSNGVVSTATNASIINRSGAPIQITGVDITAKPESGWTLVQGTPSKQFEAKEFSFLTSIENLTVLDCGQEMPFTYGASLSPTTVGEDGLDIATISVTVDWAQ